MSHDNRWSIQELIVRYELEPDLADLFVEGSFDKEVLGHSAANRGSVLAVYEIESVEVPLSVLSKYGLTLGNKQRVIALANEFEQLPSAAAVRCLIDRDLDHWFASVSDTQRLRWTKYCSIECHFLTLEIIKDIAITTARAKIGDLELFIDSLLLTLRQLYALRLADRELALNLNWVSLRKYLKRVGDTIVFEPERYVVALLNSNSSSKRKVDFDTSTRAWIDKLTCDIRLAARGHDFTSLLAWAIAGFGGDKEIANEVAVERLFVLLSRNVGSLAMEVQ
jgi:hypothetical protein